MIDVRIKNKAKELRKEGFSIGEISEKLKIAKSTASLFVRGIQLSKSAKDKIKIKSDIGRKNASKVLTERRLSRELRSVEVTQSHLKGINLSKNIMFLLCSMIYECEGGKSNFGGLEFTNSDPAMVKIFLHLLRKSFVLDENKFRVVMHLHSYHNEDKEKVFWSEITNIPYNKFLKTYNKKESGFNKKENYRGCVQIKYFDVSIKRTLLAGKTILITKMGL